MTPSTLNELDGTIKSKSLVELLSKKVELKKELIILKKLLENRHNSVKKSTPKSTSLATENQNLQNHHHYLL